MSLRAYLARQWEYLLAVALLLVSAGCACWAAIDGALGWAGLATFSVIGFYQVAIAFADADDFRQRIAEAARRQERSEVL